ncbi:ExeA family protein [Desulfobacterota bacterium M19]
MIDHLAFFGFKETPFSLTPDRDFYFPSSRHKALEKVIMFGIDEGEGFIVVSGEVGTGKTMVLKHLTAELAEKYEIALVFSPLLSPRELVLAILRDIGLRSGNTDESIDSLLAALNDHLFKLSLDNKRLIIIVDEAQDLYPESIEQLRLLSNFESDKQKFIQIILVGQPELLTLIEQPNLRQLLQRVTIIEELAPLSKREMIEYVHYRLSQAGRSDLRLSKSTANILWRYSKGVPRLINWLMNRALLAACARQSRQITPECMYDAVDFLERKDRSPLFRGKYKLFLLLALGAVAAVIFYRLGFLVK